jgi:hypothetical protein
LHSVGEEELNMDARPEGSSVRIIVLDLRNKSDHPELGQQLAEMIRVIVPETPGFEVIDRGVIASRLTENQRRFEDLTDSGAASEIGKLFDFEYLVAGDVGLLGDVYTVNVKLIDSRSLTLIKAEGLEFQGLLESRKIIRGLLANILGHGRVSGRPVISQQKLEGMEKKSSISLSISIASVIAQAALFGLALAFPGRGELRRLWPSLALLVPPLTVLYTADWNIAPYTVGFAVGAGTFNFIGRLLWDHAAGDPIRFVVGVVMIILGAGAKLYSVIVDIVRATSSVKVYNRNLRSRFYVS